MFISFQVLFYCTTFTSGKVGIVDGTVGKIRDKARHVTNPKYRVAIHFYTGWIPAGNLHHTTEWASLPSMSGMKANVRTM